MINEEVQQGESTQQPTIEPIYKTKDGQIVTKSQLVNSGYTDDRINKGVGNKILSVIGDTNHPDQEFTTKDKQKVSTKDLLSSGYTQDRIDKGIVNGILSPVEKKNPSTTTSKGLQDGVLPSTTPTTKEKPVDLNALKTKFDIATTSFSTEARKKANIPTSKQLFAIGYEGERKPVEEHEDGTISVTPSILVDGHNEGEKTQRHGYLTRGIWTEC